MNCASSREKLNELLDGMLGDAERREILAHIEACPACAEKKRSTERLLAELRALARPEGAAEGLERLRGAFRAEMEVNRPAASAGRIHSFYRRFGPARVAAMLAAVAIGAIVFAERWQERHVEYRRETIGERAVAANDAANASPKAPQVPGGFAREKSESDSGTYLGSGKARETAAGETAMNRPGSVDKAPDMPGAAPVATAHVDSGDDKAKVRRLSGAKDGNSTDAFACVRDAVQSFYEADDDSRKDDAVNAADQVDGIATLCVALIASEKLKVVANEVADLEESNVVSAPTAHAPPPEAKKVPSAEKGGRDAAAKDAKESKDAGPETESTKSAPAAPSGRSRGAPGDRPKLGAPGSAGSAKRPSAPENPVSVYVLRGRSILSHVRTRAESLRGTIEEVPIRSFAPDTQKVGGRDRDVATLVRVEMTDAASASFFTTLEKEDGVTGRLVASRNAAIGSAPGGASAPSANVDYKSESTGGGRPSGAADAQASRPASRPNARVVLYLIIPHER